MTETAKQTEARAAKEAAAREKMHHDMMAQTSKAMAEIAAKAEEARKAAEKATGAAS